MILEIALLGMMQASTSNGPPAVSNGATLVVPRVATRAATTETAPNVGVIELACSGTKTTTFSYTARNWTNTARVLFAGNTNTVVSDSIVAIDRSKSEFIWGEGSFRLSENET